MRQDQKIIISLIITSIAILLGGLVLLTKTPSSSQNSNIEGVDTKLLIKEDSLKVSTPSAEISIIEFSDYQCPACAVADSLIKQLLIDFPGKINFAFRHFPLPQNKNSTLAAYTVEAASEQDKFLEMSGKLFDTQEDWGKSSKPLELFLKYAEEFDLDNDKLKEDVESKKFADKIQRDIEDALSLKINSTPTIYINNQKYQGSLTYEELKAQVEQKLTK